MPNLYDIGGIFKRTAKRYPTPEEVMEIGKMQRENKAFEDPALGVSAIESFGLEKTQPKIPKIPKLQLGGSFVPSTVFDEGIKQPSLGEIQAPQYITGLSEEEKTL